MFEHMKNYELLLRKVASWLRPFLASSETLDDPGPLLFVHIFCHKTMPYHFEENDGWMAQTFFTGNIPLLPSLVISDTVPCQVVPCHPTISWLVYIFPMYFRADPPPDVLPIRLDIDPELVSQRPTLFPYTRRLASQTRSQRQARHLGTGN